MPPRGYKTITLKEELIKQIKKLISEHPELGYTSESEFIKEAIREKLQKFFKKY